MNIEEAKYIRYEVSHGDIRVEDFIAAEAKGFLECHEKYKPLVEALKHIQDINDDDKRIEELCENVLSIYRKEILGEK